MAPRKKAAAAAAGPKTAVKKANPPLEQSLQEVSEAIAERVVELLAGSESGSLVKLISAQVVDQISAEVVKQISTNLVQQISADIVANISDKLGGNTGVSKPGDDGNQDTSAKVKKPAASTSSRQTKKAAASAAGSKRPSPGSAQDAPLPKKAKTANQAPVRRNPRRGATPAPEPVPAESVTIDSATTEPPMPGPATTKPAEIEPAVTEPEEPAPLPEDILKETMRPLTPEEIAEWTGWCEVESDPDSFNHIINKLGVEGAVVREVLSFDPMGLMELPQPLFGLIFLFRDSLIPQEEPSDQGADDGVVWFANQTADNSCASMALLNILMNSDSVNLGPELREFKESTSKSSSVERGYKIQTNTFIRSAHNSFVRRIDQLIADLCVDVEFQEAEARPPKKPGRPAKAKTAKKPARKVTKIPAQHTYERDGYHYIACVPAGGSVWLLDGIKNRPYNAGTIGSDNWLKVARASVQRCLDEFDNTDLAFSVLGLCQCPMITHRSLIASCAASLRQLEAQHQANSTFSEFIRAEKDDLGLHESAGLGEFGLGPSDVDAAQPLSFVSDSLPVIIGNPELALDIYQQVANQARIAMSQYRQEIIEAADGDVRIKKLKCDYTPALHAWMTKLAEKGVLDEIINATQ